MGQKNQMDPMTKLFLFLGDLSDRCLTTEDSPDSNVLCSKILLVAGGSSEVEFLDSCMDCEEKGCLEIENYPLELEEDYWWKSFGGVLNQTVVICHSVATNSLDPSNCYKVGDDGKWSLLGTGPVCHGCAAATVEIQGEEFLWVTGKYLTKLVDAEGNISDGINFPVVEGSPIRDHHCMASFEHTVLVTGGYRGSHQSTITNGVIIFNTSNSFSYIEGPNMIEDRFNHACSIIVSPAHEGRPLAIMAGKNTAEVLDFSIPGSNWQLSKYLYLCGFKYDLRMETFHWKGNN